MKVKIQNNVKHLCADSIGSTKAENKYINQSGQLHNFKSSGVTPKACGNENQKKTLKKNTNPLNPRYRERGQDKILHKATSSCTQNLNEKMTFNKKDSVSQSRYILMIIVFNLFSKYLLCVMLLSTVDTGMVKPGFGRSLK